MWAFDPEPGWPDDTLVDENRYARVAVDGCQRCPILAACSAAAHDRPPEHFAVQGGWIWFAGNPYSLAAWGSRHGKYGRHPVRRIECPTCGTLFQSRTPGRRFCDQRCRNAFRRARPAKCGTLSGHVAHVRRHEPICDPCRAARRSYLQGRVSRLADVTPEFDNSTPSGADGPVNGPTGQGVSTARPAVTSTPSLSQEGSAA